MLDLLIVTYQSFFHKNSNKNTEMENTTTNGELIFLGSTGSPNLSVLIVSTHYCEEVI